MVRVIELTDTHCHIQFADYMLDPEQVITEAAESGVSRMIVVGCSLPDSQAAPVFAMKHENVWASIGLHPHEASKYIHDHYALQQFHDLGSAPKVVAIGETGLDYYYEHSPKKDQKQLLRFQLDMAAEYKLPVIFHVRDAFDDFWEIFDEYAGVTGVIHSFSSTVADMEEILKRNLYIGLNGIMTFTKRSDQLEAAKRIPLEKLVLETDAPFLTPVPFRGKIGEPKYVRATAEFLADLRGESLEDLARATTSNARQLFSI